MAGSRLEKVGTVFTRVRDLMRSGVMKPNEKPIWFDVYKAFPPKRDPLFVKPHTRPVPKRPDVVPEIFYAEDTVRAKFFEVYGAGPRPLDLSKSNYVSICQRFVEKYEELRNTTDLDEAALFEETGKHLLAQGVVLRRRGPSMVAPENRDPVLELKLTDMLAEQQALSTEEEDEEKDTPTNTPPQAST